MEGVAEGPQSRRLHGMSAAVGTRSRRAPFPPSVVPPLQGVHHASLVSRQDWPGVLPCREAPLGVAVEVAVEVVAQLRGG